MNPFIQEANQQFVSVYNRYPIILDHGEGMYLYDTDGKRYLDFGSGIGVCGLGYHDPNYPMLPGPSRAQPLLAMNWIRQPILLLQPTVAQPTARRLPATSQLPITSAPSALPVSPASNTLSLISELQLR